MLAAGAWRGSWFSTGGGDIVDGGVQGGSGGEPGGGVGGGAGRPNGDDKNGEEKVKKPR